MIAFPDDDGGSRPAPAPRFITVCAWCGDGELDAVRARNRGESCFITHGICEACAALVRAGRAPRRNPFPAPH